MDEITFVRIKNNEDYDYLNFLKQGLLDYPDRFKLSPDDDIVSVFPSPNIHRGFTLGVAVQNRLIGIVTFTAFNDRKKLAHIGEISRMYISNEAQGKKIGFRLIAELLNIVQNDYREIRQVKLNVVTHNENAKRLYRKFGFEHFATEKNCIRLGEEFLDDDTMVLFLKNN